MHPIVEDIMSYRADDVGCDIDILMHYGIKRRSGRYPWGSGERPFQSGEDFLARVEHLRSQGLSEKDICEDLKMTSTEFRRQERVAKHDRRRLEAARAQALRDDGLTLQEIAVKMGYSSDSSVRALLNKDTSANKDRAYTTADKLEAMFKDGANMIDIGAGVEHELGVTRGTLDEAAFILNTRGYDMYGIGLAQPTNPKQQTITTILAKEGYDEKYAYNHTDEIMPVGGEIHSTDGGATFTKLQYPASIDSSRVFIRYGDEGGASKDGVIELRPNVDDLSLGDSRFAQVRILVDDDKYLKGMAMYSHDVPDGYDIIFNTNKKSGTDPNKVMKSVDAKKLEMNPDNPFGATIKANGQSWYDAADGTKKLSAINKLKEEGDWETMSKNLSSQFLSKQPLKLISQQLDLTHKEHLAEFDEIMGLENPTVKKAQLLEFANKMDGAAVHIQAAALPRQSTQVILPINDISDTEAYAPAYKNGEKLALIRYPHGGTFEIPIVTVNNKNAEGIRNIGSTVTEAIGINSRVAERLSGADFDGDQVVCIPIGPTSNIKSTKPLKELEGFDPKTAYPQTKTSAIMPEKMKQKQMGMVSNLITDMTLQNAPNEDIVKAVKHSMVVIDSVKHKLDYKQSEIDNDISTLKNRYQKHPDLETGELKGGASTLISRHAQTVKIPERRGSGKINPDTGKVEYKESGRTYVDKKTGKVTKAMIDIPLLNYVDDARTLSSGTAQENMYADYINKTNALAATARKTYLTVKDNPIDISAKTRYSAEVASLNAKLVNAQKNAPRERRAIAIANSQIKAIVADNPDMDKKDYKRMKQQTLTRARDSVGASGRASRIQITQEEWNAIQAGAISATKLNQVLRYADSAKIKELAMPKASTSLSSAKIAKAKAMASSGYTIAEIAESLGVSTSTISRQLNSKGGKQ